MKSNDHNGERTIQEDTTDDPSTRRINDGIHGQPTTNRDIIEDLIGISQATQNLLGRRSDADEGKTTRFKE